MTSTTNKNLNVPAHGSFANTWDVPVNSNWETIDDAFGGSTFLDVSGLSGVVALTILQCTPPNVDVIGVLTAAVNFQVPSDVGGVWSIRNGTTGAFTLTWSSATGAGSVILPQGQRTAVIENDGNGIDYLSTNYVAGGSNQDVQYNSGGQLGGSSNFTFDGTHLAAPDFEGTIGGVTPAVGTFSAINGPIGGTTPDAGTFTAINGPIGGTTPAAGAFTTVTASGAVILAAATAVSVPTLAPGTNTTGAASTAFVTAAVATAIAAVQLRGLVRWTPSGTIASFSGNISTVVRNSAGQYTITFTTSVGSTNYYVALSVSGQVGGGYGAISETFTPDPVRTATAITVVTFDTNNHIVTDSTGDSSLMLFY